MDMPTLLIVALSVPSLALYNAGAAIFRTVGNSKLPMKIMLIDMAMIKRILGIGAPYGLENGMFHFGRLLVLSLVATFGTTAIAANSVGGTIVTFQALPGMAIGMGLTVIISRCVGAGD